MPGCGWPRQRWSSRWCATSWWDTARSTRSVSGRAPTTPVCSDCGPATPRCSTTTGSGPPWKLFDADRASLITATVLGVIAHFDVATTQLHNDSTWIHHGSSSRERVGARECPSDLGEYG